MDLTQFCPRGRWRFEKVDDIFRDVTVLLKLCDGTSQPPSHQPRNSLPPIALAVRE